jgi:cytochrome c
MRGYTFHRHVMWCSCAALLIAGAIAVSGSCASAQEADTANAAFNKCLACHSVGAQAQHKNGPQLNGISGKPAGGTIGFVYSEAFQAAMTAGLVWSDENLDKFLTDPVAFIPGSRMAWAVPDPAERSAIITYLKTLP